MSVNNALIITYLHNSGIAIETDDILVVIDYAMHTPGPKGVGFTAGIISEDLIQSKRKVIVLVTHKHIDHYNRNILKWKEKYNNVIYIFSDDIQTDEDVIFISCGERIVVEGITIIACASNDEGISFWLQIEETKIFHAGDMSLWYWESELGSKDLKKNKLAYRIAKTSYLKALESVKNREIDIAFCPLNPMLGETYSEGALIFCEKIKPRLFVPVHFGLSFEVTKEFKDNFVDTDVDIWAIQDRGEQYIYNI